MILIFIAEPDLVDTLADFVFEYVFLGRIRGLSGPEAENMVEYGVSRFKMQEAQTDEPLAILALVSFLEQKNQLSLTKYLARELNTSHPTSRGLVFEPFSTYLLACAFSEPKKLSDVFECTAGNAQKGWR